MAGPKTLPTTAWKAAGGVGRSALELHALVGGPDEGEDAIGPARVDELPGSFSNSDFVSCGYATHTF